MADRVDASGLSDRELLVLTYQMSCDTKEAIFGNGQPGIVTRLAAVETRVEERTSKKEILGVAGLVTLIVNAGFDLIKSKMGL